VPDDHALATCDELSVWENIALSRMAWLEARTPRNRRRLRQFARARVTEFDIRTPSINTPVGRLSGGNRRRVVLARELSKRPALAVLCFATKGLDVRSAEQVKQWTRRIAAEGAAVVYIASDLEELFEVSDRVAVLARGRLTGILTAAEATTQRVGSLMLVGTGEEDAA
jgi:general nucleoside transport system ATP-binding protein